MKHTEEKIITLNILKHECGHPPNVVEVCETNANVLKIYNLGLGTRNPYREIPAPTNAPSSHLNCGKM